MTFPDLIDLAIQLETLKDEISENVQKQNKNEQESKT